MSIVVSNRYAKPYLFFAPLLSIVSRREMTIKHLLYMQLCAFKYTKGACVVFFRFWNSPMKIFYVVETVASISDQREYHTLLDHRLLHSECFNEIYTLGE